MCVDGRNFSCGTCHEISRRDKFALLFGSWSPFTIASPQWSFRSGAEADAGKEGCVGKHFHGSTLSVLSNFLSNSSLKKSS